SITDDARATFKTPANVRKSLIDLGEECRRDRLFFDSRCREGISPDCLPHSSRAALATIAKLAHHLSATAFTEVEVLDDLACHGFDIFDMQARRFKVLGFVQNGDHTVASHLTLVRHTVVGLPEQPHSRGSHSSRRAEDGESADRRCDPQPPTATPVPRLRPRLSVHRLHMPQ